jgi:hypothetical protein
MLKTDYELRSAVTGDVIRSFKITNLISGSFSGNEPEEHCSFSSPTLKTVSYEILE